MLQVGVSIISVRPLQHYDQDSEHANPAAFLALAVVGLFHYPDLSAGLTRRLALGNQDLHLTQVGEYLHRAELLLRQCYPCFRPNPNTRPGFVLEVR